MKVKKDRKIAVGFVSIPPLNRPGNPPKDAKATARLLIAKLTQYKIPADVWENRKDKIIPPSPTPLLPKKTQ